MEFSTSKILVFDGGIGTELYERGFYINKPFEELNLTAPSDVEQVHQDFINAGADVITTNTFAATPQQLARFDIQDRQQEIIQSAIRIAKKAKGDNDVLIALSIGPTGELVEPLGPLSLDAVKQCYKQIAEFALDENGFDCFLLETFIGLDELASAVEGIASLKSGKPIIASISVTSDQKEVLSRFCRDFGKSPNLMALGLNCADGPYNLLQSLKAVIPHVHLPIVVQPNAGIPKQINGRYFYMTSPDYLAKYAKRFVEAGTLGIGGCCGTGPDHIAAIKKAVRMVNAQKSSENIQETLRIQQSEVPIGSKDFSERPLSKIGRKLKHSEKVISVELLPPKGVELDRFMQKIAQLAEKGVEFVNVPDGARASARVSSLHIAAYIASRPELGVTVIPHLTSRDRNLIGLQSDLLGASINAVNEVLLITGDPPKLGNNKQATGVYDVDAIGLTHIVNCLNHGQTVKKESLGSQTQFSIGVAANPTAQNLDLELNRFHYKMEMGADYAVTQPIFSAEAYFKWIDSLKGDSIPHFLGIWPLVSLRNAEFLANEVPGVYVPNDIIKQFQKVSQPADGIKLGQEIAQKVMEETNQASDGYVISAPMSKVEVVLELL